MTTDKKIVWATETFKNERGEEYFNQDTAMHYLYLYHELGGKYNPFPKGWRVPTAEEALQGYPLVEGLTGGNSYGMNLSGNSFSHNSRMKANIWIDRGPIGPEVGCDKQRYYAENVYTKHDGTLGDFGGAEMYMQILLVKEVSND